MLWPGALSAAFLLQCGGESDKAARRAPPRAGSGGISAAGAGTGGDGGACVGCAGKGGTAGSVAGGSGRGGSTPGGSGGALAGAGKGGAPAAGIGGGGAGSGGSSGTPSEGGEAGGFTPADGGVTLTKLSAYQAVEVRLVSGREPTRNAPVVVGRRTLVRAFLTPRPAFTPGLVTGTLTVDDGAAQVELSATIDELAGASTQGDLGTTLNFDVPAGRITAATTLSLVINGEGGELLRFPESAPFALGAENANGNLQLTLVPLVVNGFAPDLSEATVKSYSSLVRGMLPIPGADVTVRAPHALDFDVTADGWGWDEALDELYTLRAADDPADDVYYYGVLSPGATMDDWCPDGCTVGLSVVASAAEVEYRGSIGVGFFETPRDVFSPETMVHELGHAMGRDHSPCDTDDGDPRFPYADGSIGSWGLHAGILRDPRVDADVMGYCTPVWVSDYTFDHLFTRIAYVNRTALKVTPAPSSRVRRERVRTLTVRPDGTLRWGRERPGSVRSSGTPTNVELLDAGGRVLSVVSAPFARFDHLPGGFVTLPAFAMATPGLASVRALGRGLLAP
jgi:hypothetical protein